MYDARRNDRIADISLTGGEQKKMRRRTRYGQVVRALSRSIEQIRETDSIRQRVYVLVCIIIHRRARCVVKLRIRGNGARREVDG